MAFIRRWCPLW